ncbi:PfkB family carbohydrate kinase, partial [Arthrospira platensis SPKY2]
ILTVTLNPAVDFTTAADHIEPGPKLRCDPPVIEPGGGGVNVSRMIRLLGGESTALVAIGGATGELMRSLLVGGGLDCAFVEAHGDTRMSFAVHERGTTEQYRFVLPGPEQDLDFAPRVIERLEALLLARPYACVVGSGSLPPGVPDDFYA